MFSTKQYHKSIYRHHMLMFKKADNPQMYEVHTKLSTIRIIRDASMDVRCHNWIK